MGTAAPAKLPDTEAPPSQTYKHANGRIWTPARVVPLVGAGMIAVIVASVRPSVEFVMLGVLGEILCSVGIFKEWARSS